MISFMILLGFKMSVSTVHLFTYYSKHLHSSNPGSLIFLSVLPQVVKFLDIETRFFISEVIVSLLLLLKI
ncbi:MAG: hypothetical protein B2I18_05270 [Cuniculiplasma sp. C_DKE]|nr:MAG: hypothetical protein B2I18_05270 [Cuniculiplasma sp. C_DKE]